MPESARAPFLEQACGDDLQLRAEIEALLKDPQTTQATFQHERPTLPGAHGDRPLAGGTRMGPWNIEQLVGRGGMGEVYAARRADGAFDLRVAIKLLKRGLDSEAVVARFGKERRILAQLDHPNIARVLDAGVAADGRPFLAMEFVEGQSITDYARTQELSTAAVLRLMITVCEAVQAAHSKLIVHRDLKPSNVLVTATGQVKLLDFGIAKALADEDAESTRLAGDAMALTPAYAAPEQLLGQPPSPATDVYALGIILYQLLTERLPHRRAGHSLTEIALNLEGESIQRPSTVLRNERGRMPEPHRLERLRATPRDLDLIVLKALHVESGRRYAVAQRLAEDLHRLIEQRPVLARPDSIIYRMRKFVRRHRVGVLSSGAFLALLLAGVITITWEARLARQQAHQATAVKDFLLDVFQQADPTHTQGETMTARALLDQGTRKLHARLSSEPLVEAELYDAIAKIYGSLGLNDRALELARSSLEVRRAQLGPNDERIAQSLSTLGDLYNGKEESEHARDVLTQAAAIESRRGHSDPIAMARIDSYLAEAMAGLGERDKALALQRSAYQTYSHMLGPNDPDTAEQAMYLGMRLEESGEYAEAETRYREALAGMTAASGPEDGTVGHIHMELGGILDRVGKREEADLELQKSIVILRKVYGDSHPTVATALFSRAILLIGSGRFAEADAALIETLRICPPGSLQAAQSQRYLGISLLREKRYVEARVASEHAVQAFHAVGKDGEAQGFRALADEATAALKLGDAKTAEATLREAVSGLDRLLGPDSYEVRNPLKGLAEALMALNRNTEALVVLERVHALELKLFGSPEHRELIGTEDLMAQAILNLHDKTQLPHARALADHALALSREKLPAETGTALLIDGHIALAGGDLYSAKALLTEAIPALTASEGSSAAKTLEAKKLLLQAGRA